MNGLEPRVAQLEAYTDMIRGDVADMKTNMKTVQSKLGEHTGRLSTIEEQI